MKHEYHPSHQYTDEELTAYMDGILVDDHEHALHVARLATELFHITWPLHGFGDQEEKLLVRAALLHDAGILVAYKKHHKHSMQIILEHDFPDLTTGERKEIACIARYHRKALPNRHHPVYRNLSAEVRKRIDQLGGILRLADAFDYEHDGRVSHLYGYVLSTPNKQGMLIVRASHAIDDVDSLQRVMQQAHLKCILFEKAFYTQLSISFENERKDSQLFNGQFPVRNGIEQNLQ